MEKLSVEVERLPRSQSTSEIAERALKFFYGNKEEAISFINVHYGPASKHFGAHGFGSQIIDHIKGAKVIKIRKKPNLIKQSKKSKLPKGNYGLE